jgi:hypothetical protein
MTSEKIAPSAIAFVSISRCVEGFMR